MELIMKIFKYIFLMIIVVSIVFCSKNNLLTGYDYNNIVKYNKIIESYQSVLENMDMIKKIFKDNYYYSEPFAYNDEDYDYFKINFFTVVDMDNDNIPEIILETSMMGDVLVLYYYDEIIYGYTCPYRGILRLKKDGTFGFSSGAGDSGRGVLKFSSNECEYIEIWREIWDNNYDFNMHKEFYTRECYIYGDQVSEEKFDLFINGQVEAEDAEWYDFNETSIENILTSYLNSTANRR